MRRIQKHEETIERTYVVTSRGSYAFGDHITANGNNSGCVRPGYQYIEQTESQEVIELTEQVAELYPICPELLQALIFYESGNQRTVVSRWGDIGYMQVNPRWMRPWMDKLGATDLMDGYNNILVGTDYLCELFQEYGDPALVLMAYNQGPDKAVKLYDSGEISEYARKILELSAELERMHGK